MRAGETRQMEVLSRLAGLSAGPERERVATLQQIMADKAGLDVHMSVQRALRYWLMVHVPPAAMLLGLLVVHVFAVMYL